MEKSAKTKRRFEDLTAEVSKLRRIAEEQASILECSICKTLPRDGPVPCCHFVCSPCLKQWQESQANRNTCPTCRCSMGTGKSLLAVTVIKHALHSCSNLHSQSEKNTNKIYERTFRLKRIIWTVFRLSGQFVDCPDNFRIIWTVS